MKKYLIFLFSLISVFGYAQTLHPTGTVTALSVNNSATLPIAVTGTNSYEADLPDAGTITDATNFFTDITDRLLYYKFANAATAGPFTLDLEGRGAKTLKKKDATGTVVDITTADIPAANTILPIRYNGTYLVIEGGSGGGGGSDVVFANDRDTFKGVKDDESVSPEGLKSVTDYLTKPSKITIHGSATTNFRADASSVIQLNDSTYLMAYGVVTGNIEDNGLFDIFTTISTDYGKTYSTPVKAFNRIGGFSTYIPSLHKREDGSVFMIVLVQPTLVTSELWKVESADGGFTFGGAQAKLYGLTDEYYAPAPDRIYKTTTGRLIYAFNRNTNPPNLGSALGNYVGMFLHSDDDGVTWTVNGTSGTSIVTSPDSFCGEPGIFREVPTSAYAAGEVLVCYYRTRSGFVYAARSSDDGATWAGGPTSFSTGLEAQNSTTTIEYDSVHGIYVAATNKYWADNGYKNKMILAVSHDARTWSYIDIIDQEFSTNPIIIEPTIYFVNDLVKIVYTKSNEAINILTLYQKTFPFSYVQTPGIKQYDGIKIRKGFYASTSDFMEIYADNVSTTNGFYKISNLAGAGNVFGIWEKYRTSGVNWGKLKTIHHPANVVGEEWDFNIDGTTGPITNNIFKIRNGASSGSGGTTVFDLYPSSVMLPKGTTAQRPATSGTGLVAGAERYNTDNNVKEYWDGSSWIQVGSSAAGSFWTTTGTSTFTGPVTVVGSATNTLKFQFDNLSTTLTNGAGLMLQNTTAAANGAQQISPIFTLRGNGWKTNATAASQTTDMSQYVLPVQGSANPFATWILNTSINGAAATNTFSIRHLPGTSAIATLGNSGETVQLTINSTAGSSGIYSPAYNSGSNNILELKDFSSVAMMRLNGSGASNTRRSIGVGNNFTADLATFYVNQSPVSGTNGIPVFMTRGASMTALLGSVELSDVVLDGSLTPGGLARTKEFATGLLSLQRTVRVVPETLAFVGSSTVTEAITMTIEGAPAAGTNATITNSFALGVTNGDSFFDDRIKVGANTGTGTVGPVSTIDNMGSMGAAITTITSDATLDVSHHTVLCDATSGNITITLPSASSATRRIYIIKKIDASGNTVSFTTADGSIVISTQWAGKQIQSNGTSYYVTGNF